MAESLASLGIVVDSSGVAQGTQNLDQLADAAERAEGAAQGVGSAVKRAGTEAAAGGQAAAAAGRGFVQNEKAVGAAAMSAKQYSQSMRVLPMQITDVVTRLASGRPIHTVAIRQGGQLRDSFGGFGAALRAIGTIISPSILAIGAIGGAAAVAAKAFLDGRREAFEFNKALVLSGNVAGTTVGQLNEQAKAIDRVVGTQAQASRVLADLAASGKVAGDRLQEAATLALQLEKSAGISADQTVKAFVELGRRPVEAVKRLNEQYNFLTASTYKQIVALAEQGREWEASDLAQRTFFEEMSPRVQEVEERLGGLQRAAKATGGFFREMWDEVLNIGRDQTPEERLTQIDKEIAHLDKYYQSERHVIERMRRDNLAAERDQLRPQVNEGNYAAMIERETALHNQRQIEAADREAATATKAREAAAREAEAIRKAMAGARLADIRRELRIEADAYDQQGKLLDAYHSAGQIGAEAYYTERKRLIQEASAAQIGALEAEKAALQAAGGTQLERLQNLERIKDIEVELAAVRSGMATEVEVLGTAEVARLDAIARSYDDARTAAESYLATQQRAWQRELEGMGQGRLARDRDSGRNAIDDRYERQRQQIESDRRSNPNANPEQFEDALRLVDEFHAKELTAYEQHWQALRAGESSWRVGVGEAINNYLDESANFAKTTDSIVTDSLRNSEDAVARFVRTGKLSFKELSASIIASMSAVGANKLIGSLLGLVGGRGGISPDSALQMSLAPLAKGGVFNSPSLRSYVNTVVDKPTMFAFAKGGVMGEAGPEAIMPLQRDPSGRLGVIAQGGGAEFNLHIHGAPSQPAVSKRRNASGGMDIDLVFKQIEGWMADRFASGASPLNGAMRGRYGLEAT